MLDENLRRLVRTARTLALALALALVVAWALSLGAAHAEALRTTERGHVVDWSAGQLVARGLGVADRRAPSPAVARDAARRRARADAVRQLAAGAAQLPLAGGERLGEQLDQARLGELAAAEAIVTSAELLVDGSWRVEVALPLEALRQAVYEARGARALPTKGDAGATPAVVIVRAPKGTAPRLGLTFGDGQRSVRPATLWARGSLEGVPLTERALAAAPSLTASRPSGAAGADELRVPRLGQASDATLFVVVLGE